MAVVELIYGLEERFGGEGDGDEVTADVFEALGSLAAFVETQIAWRAPARGATTMLTEGTRLLSVARDVLVGHDLLHLLGEPRRTRQLTGGDHDHHRGRRTTSAHGWH